MLFVVCRSIIMSPTTQWVGDILIYTCPSVCHKYCPLSKSNSFHQIFTKLHSNMCSYNILTKIDNQPHPSMRLRVTALDFYEMGYFSLVRSLSQIVFIESSPNLFKICSAIISQLSSITSRIGQGTAELRPFIFQKLAILALSAL